MRKTHGLALMVAAFLLTACAGQPAQERTLADRLQDRGFSQGEPVRSIQKYRLDGWHYLDSRNLIIETGPRQRYLVTLRTPCHELSSADSIGFTTTAGQLSRFDKVVFRETSGGRRECVIEELYVLERLDGEEDEATGDPG